MFVSCLENEIAFRGFRPVAFVAGRTPRSAAPAAVFTTETYGHTYAIPYEKVHMD